MKNIQNSTHSITLINKVEKNGINRSIMFVISVFSYKHLPRGQGGPIQDNYCDGGSLWGPGAPKWALRWNFEHVKYFGRGSTVTRICMTRISCRTMIISMIIKLCGIYCRFWDFRRICRFNFRYLSEISGILRNLLMLWSILNVSFCIIKKVNFWLQ